MLSLARTATGVVTAPARVTLAVALAAPVLAAELPALIRNARVLIEELAWLSRDAPRGALTDLVEDLARLAGEEGELTALLREQARLAAVRADEASRR